MGANKNFVKLLWVIGVLIFILIIALICVKLKNKKADETENPAEVKYKKYDINELKSIYLSKNHMNQMEGYNFSLQEQEGNISLSAHFYTGEGKEIKIEKMNLESKDMEKIEAIIEDNGYNNVKIESKKDNKKNDSILVHDATSYTFNLGWKDGTTTKVEYPGSSSVEIVGFLKELAIIYAQKQE